MIGRGRQVPPFLQSRMEESRARIMSPIIGRFSIGLFVMQTGFGICKVRRSPARVGLAKAKGTSITTARTLRKNIMVIGLVEVRWWYL